MIDAVTREAVRLRAGYRCEYCRLRQRHLPGHIFHIEHIVARKHCGSDELANLALACAQCNLHKGADLSGIDPQTGVVVQLFHPRLDGWMDHFRFDGSKIIGLTACRRATVSVLQMNSDERVELRGVLAALGELD